MRVTVTGGAGFVGSHIVRALVAVGHHVRVVDDLSTGRVENLEGVEVVRAIGDAGSLEYAGDDAIVHAAAYPDVSANWKHPRERERQWNSNADLTRRVLERTPEGAIFIMLSTCSVYGGGRDVWEDTPTRSTSPYAASKLAAEALVEAHHEARKVYGITMRLVNVVGARYAHGHLADFVRQASEGKLHALDDGRKAKSFVHAGDIADEIVAQLAAVKHARFHGGPEGPAQQFPRLFNLTSRTCWSWRDSVAVMRAMRPAKAFELTCENRRAGWIGDPDELVVSSRHLDARPRRSIVDGVHEALTDLGW